MIKANELKLNNYVISDLHKGLITQIKNLNPNSVRLWANPFATYTYDDISPIPLTPEILVKCGCTEQVGEWQFLLRISALKMFFRFNSGKCYSELGGIYLGDRISDLHTLQNLYQPLTDNELTINL